MIAVFHAGQGLECVRYGTENRSLQRGLGKNLPLLSVLEEWELPLDGKWEKSFPVFYLSFKPIFY